MGHFLKIKCIDSRVKVHILASNEWPFYTHDGASAKFSTNSHETDNSVAGKTAQRKLAPLSHIFDRTRLAPKSPLPLSADNKQRDYDNPETNSTNSIRIGLYLPVHACTSHAATISHRKSLLFPSFHQLLHSQSQIMIIWAFYLQALCYQEDVFWINLSIWSILDTKSVGLVVCMYTACTVTNESEG